MTVQTSTADFEPAAFIIMQKRSMFVLECAGEAVVSVLRLGSTEEPCEVDFETGGVGGHKATDADFVAVDGTLKFAPGQRSAAIRVPIKDDAHWEPMEVFEVRLLAARSAELGGNATTLVHIVDDDTYPEAMPPRASAGRLVWAVIRERWRSRGKKPYQAVFFNQYDTLHKLAGTYAPLLIIELELAAHPWALFVVAAAYLASALYMWYSKWKFEDVRGSAGTRLAWRNWMVNRYLWMGEDTHLKIEPIRFFHTLSNDVDEASDQVWKMHFELISGAIDLVIQLVAGIATLGFVAAVPVFVVLPALALVLACACQSFMQKLDRRHETEQGWMTHVADLFSNWLLVQAHEMRDEFSVAFEKKNKAFYEAHKVARNLKVHMQLLPFVANELGLAIFLVVGAIQAYTDDEFGAARFFTTAAVYRQVGAKTLDVVKAVVIMAKGVVALRQVVDAINLPLGIDFLLEPMQDGGGDCGGNHSRRDSGTTPPIPGDGAAKSGVANDSVHNGHNGHDNGGLVKHPPEDLAELTGLRLTDVSFSYPLGPPLLDRVCGSLELGHIYMLRRDGDSLSSSWAMTMLKLVARHIVPASGAVAVPPHLKVRLVPTEPLLFSTTLLANLVPTTTRATPMQIWSMCQAVGLSSHLIGQPDFKVGTGGGSLKLVDRQLICLLRAILSDPDLLLLSKPGALLKPQQRANLYRVLGLWVDEGLEGVAALPERQAAAAVLQAALRGRAARKVGASDAPTAASNVALESAAAEGAAAAAARLPSRIARRQVRTALCSADASFPLPDPSEIGYTPRIWDLPIGRRAKAASFKEVRDIARALSKKHHDAAAARELAAQLAAAREGQTWDEAVNAFTGFSESFKKDDCKV